MRNPLPALLLVGLVGAAVAGCPKKYDSGADTVAPVPADTATPAPPPEKDTATPAPEPDTAAPAPPADTEPAAPAGDDAIEAPAPTDDAGEAPAPDTTAAAAPSPSWVVVSPASEGAPSALLLSSQGGAAPELTKWFAPLVEKAMGGDDNWGEVFATAAKSAETRPAALADGATVRILTAAGVEERKITGLTASELGGAMRVGLPLDGAPLASWSVAAVGEVAPPAGARFVPLAEKQASEAVAAKVWSQFITMVPESGRTTLDKVAPTVKIYPATLGGDRQALVTVCVPEADMGEEACSLQGFALADAAGTIKGWLRTVTSDIELKAPTIDGVVCDSSFGTSVPYGVLYSGDQVAVLTGLFAIGDEIYDLIHLSPGPVRAERLFEMIVE